MTEPKKVLSVTEYSLTQFFYLIFAAMLIAGFGMAFFVGPIDAICITVLTGISVALIPVGHLFVPRAALSIGGSIAGGIIGATLFDIFHTLFLSHPFFF